MKIKYPDSKFWSGKRVLVTGHTGFKGSWLVLWLQRLGAEVTGISLKPNACPNLFELANIKNLCHSYFCDIRDAKKLAHLIIQARPQIVFHLAAQPLVRESYRYPLETFSSNVMGTANVLDALRGLDSVHAAVIVTTDKVYHNKDWFWPYREDDALGGYDPYSASKAASELVVSCYRDSFLTAQGVAVVSARAGNVIGGGDWSSDRLIPDAVRAWQLGTPLIIRSPNAVRPWQHVLDPLAGYLLLAAKIYSCQRSFGSDVCTSFNFGPNCNSYSSVKDVIDLALTFYGSGEVNYLDHSDGLHEARFLELDVSKAKILLGFTSKWSLTESVRRTMLWFRDQSNGFDARDLCDAEISSYESLL